MSGERKSLTKMVLEQRAPKAGRIEVRDKESPLVFRLTSNGNRSLCVRARIGTGATGEQVRVTYPKAASIENLSDARQWARQTVDACKGGMDPREARATSEAASRLAAERAERLKFENVARNYLDRRVRREKNNRTADEIERAFNIYFVPRWKGIPISEITRSDVNDLLDDIFDRKVEHEGKQFGGNVRADRMLAQLRACFNWAATQDDKFVSPIVSGMARTKASNHKRDRALKDDEIRALWAVTATKGTFNSIVRTLLLTAQRRDEVACMARSEIAADGVWTIPKDRYKTGKENVVPLSAKASAIIAEQDQIDRCDLVFTTNGKTPFSGFGKCKDRLDADMLAKLREWSDEPDTVTLPGWRLHDLRRTAKTLMSRVGVRPDVSERVLGHVILGVEGTYDQHDYISQKRVALELLASEIDRIISPPVSNIVRLAG